MISMFDKGKEFIIFICSSAKNLILSSDGVVGGLVERGGHDIYNELSDRDGLDMREDKRR